MTGSSYDLLTFLQSQPDFLEDASAKLKRGYQEATERQGKATLELKLSIKPGKQGKNATVHIEPLDPKLTLPKLKWGKSQFFVTEDGSLSREHPDQMPLNFQPTDAEAPQLSQS